jgi:hypothetical protein
MLTWLARNWWLLLAGLLGTGAVLGVVGLAWLSADSDLSVAVGATGERPTTSDTTSLLEPTYLPAGFRLSGGVTESGAASTRTWVRDARPGEELRAELETVQEDGSLDTFTQVTEATGTEQVRVEITQGAAHLARVDPRDAVLARREVRGVTGTATTGWGLDESVCVAWAEGTAGYQVCTSGTPELLLPVHELVHIADSLV